ncbi:hypothetical protein CLOP_g9986, partial [Closterium sp. NIES-67]
LLVDSAAMASFLRILSVFLLVSSALTSSFAAPTNSNLNSLAKPSSNDPLAAISTAAAGDSATNETPSIEASSAPRRQIFTKFPDPICKRVGGCQEPIDPIDPIDPVNRPCIPPRQPCPLVLEASSADTEKGRFGCYGPQIHCNGSCCLQWTSQGISPRCCGGKCCLGGESQGLTCCLPSPTSDPTTAGTCCSTRTSFCCGGSCCTYGSTCCNGKCCEPGSTCCNGKCCAGGVKCCGGQCGCPEKSSCCGGSVCCNDNLKPQCCSIPGMRGGECCPGIDSSGEETGSFCCGQQCCQGFPTVRPRCCYSPKTGPRCCKRPIEIPIDIPIGLSITP